MPDAIVRELLALLGPERCLTAPEDCLPYGIDAGPQRAMPQMVALPETTEEVAAVLRLAATHHLPVVPRGAGSGLTGGAVPLAGGLVLSLDRMHRILEIDPANLIAVVEPNVVTAQLNQAARAQGLFFAPDPASMAFSTVGGNIAENAGGMRAVKYGVTKHSVLGLEVVLADGSVIRTGSKCLKDVVGYGLTELFVGSEGTLGVVTQAILRLHPLPRAQSLLAAFFPDLASAARAVPAMLRAGIGPSTLEFLDHHCLAALARTATFTPPAGARALLLVEVDGRPQETQGAIQEALELCQAHGALQARTAHEEASREELWTLRRSLHGALEALASHWHEEDLSVPVGRIPALLESLEGVSRELDLRLACFGHFGDGNVHLSYTGLTGALTTDQARVARERIYQATDALEGRIAAEHGIGSAKNAYLEWNLTPETVALMRRLKDALDPLGLLNPGKLFPPEAAGAGD